MIARHNIAFGGERNYGCPNIRSCMGSIKVREDLFLRVSTVKQR